MKTARPTCLWECTDGCSAVPGPGVFPGTPRHDRQGCRHAQTNLPACHPGRRRHGCGRRRPRPGASRLAPRHATAVADRPGSGQSVIDWNRQLISILGTPDAQPATVHPTRSFAMLQAAEYDAVVSITHGAAPYGRSSRAGRRASGRRCGPGGARRPARAVPVDACRPGRASCAASWSPSPRVGPRTTASRSASRPRSRSPRCARVTAPAVPPPLHRRHRAGRLPPDPPKLAAPMYTGWGSVTPFVLAQRAAVPPGRPAGGRQPRVRGGARRGEERGPRLQHHPHPGPDRGREVLESAPIWNTWNKVAQQLATDGHASLTEATTAFAAMDLALADTTIALYDAKYTGASGDRSPPSSSACRATRDPR